MSKNTTRGYETELVKEFFDWLGRNTYGEVHIGMLDYAYVDRFMEERNVQKVTCPWCKGEVPVDGQKTFYENEGYPEVSCPHCASKIEVGQVEQKIEVGMYVRSWMCEENGKEHVYEKPWGSFKFCTRCEHAEKVDVEVKK